MLDRKRPLRPAAGIGVVLHHVGPPGKPERQRAHRYAVRPTNPGPRLDATLVHPLVGHPSLGGADVLDPYPFQMDQRALARTDHYVLERGQGDQLVFGVHPVKPFSSP